MASFQAPPTFAQLILFDPKAPNVEAMLRGAKFNPIWLKWFLDLIGVVNSSGGGGGTIQHNSLGGLQGGGGTEFYHLTAADFTTLTGVIGNQSAGAVYSGPVSGAAAAPSFKVLQDSEYKASSSSQTNNTTLTNDSDLVWAIGAGEVWAFRFHLHFEAAIKTTGIKLSVAAPTGATGSTDVLVNTDATSGNETYIVNGTIGGTTDITTALLGGGAANGFIEVMGFVDNSAGIAGNVQLQWAQSTSSATALTLDAGSQVTAHRTT